jgi:RNA polymerase sigma-B factor
MTSHAGREIIPGTVMRDRLPHSEQRGGLAPLQALYRHRPVGARPSLERARRRRTDERLAMRMREGNARARDELITRYLPLARSLALRYRRHSEPADDLVQVASVALVNAIDRWDPRLGLALSSYAAPTIVGELAHYFRDRTWGIRPSRRVQELCLRLERAQETLWAELGRSPTVAELARRLDRSHGAIVEALRADQNRRLSSLDAPVNPGDVWASVGDGIGHIDRELDRVEARTTFEQLTGLLDDGPREILRLHFQQDLLQREIAERVGCSQMQVSRVIRASLETLHEHGNGGSADAAVDRPLPRDLDSPCARQVDDVAIRERGSDKRNVTADRTAEDQARPAVEAMGADGAHRTAGLTTAGGVGHLGAEQLFQEAGQRIAVEP